MAESLGHLAMGLLFASPAWALWDGRTAAAFVAFVLVTSMLPDVDLVLQAAGLPVSHHGVTHTLAFVVAFSAVAGLVGVAVLRPTLQRWWHLTEDETVQTGTVYLFVTGAFALGGTSHLVADMLAADTYQVIEPFWPFFEVSFPVHAVHYQSPWLNLGLFALAASLQAVVLAASPFPLNHRFRRWCRKQTTQTET